MPLTESEKKAHRKYIRNAYAKLHVNYPKQFVELVKQKADEKGESIAGYVRKAIEERIKRDDSDRTAPE